jgi:hypothetical protein
VIEARQANAERASARADDRARKTTTRAEARSRRGRGSTVDDAPFLDAALATMPRRAASRADRPGEACAVRPPSPAPGDATGDPGLASADHACAALAPWRMRRAARPARRAVVCIGRVAGEITRALSAISE